MRKHKRMHWTFLVRYRDRFGRLLAHEAHENMLHDEGEQFICQVAFSEEQSVPSAYYVGLDNRGSLAEGDTLASLSGEPSGNGYARQARDTRRASVARQDARGKATGCCV